MSQDGPDLSVLRRCSLLSLARPGLVDQPRGECAENGRFMAVIDRQALGTPRHGPRQMARHLQRGHRCERHRVRRAVRRMRPVPDPSRAPVRHEASRAQDRPVSAPGGPFIARPIRVRWTDISDIPMRRGSSVSVTITDRHSRKGPGRRLSTSMGAELSHGGFEGGIGQIRAARDLQFRPGFAVCWTPR